MGLLHLAVRSGKPDAVAALLEGSNADDWQVRPARLHCLAVLFVTYLLLGMSYVLLLLQCQHGLVTGVLTLQC